MEGKEQLLRVQKLSRIVRKVLRVMLVLLCVGAAALVVLAMFAMVQSDHAVLEHITVNFGGISGTAAAMSKGVLVVLALAILVKCGFYIAVLVTAERMFADIVERGTPFESIHVKRLKRIAIFILIGSFVNFFSIQMGEWVIALVIWCLSVMFDYGCVLQQQSDETL